MFHLIKLIYIVKHYKDDKSHTITIYSMYHLREWKTFAVYSPGNDITLVLKMCEMILQHLTPLNIIQRKVEEEMLFIIYNTRADRIFGRSGLHYSVYRFLFLYLYSSFIYLLCGSTRTLFLVVQFYMFTKDRE